MTNPPFPVLTTQQVREIDQIAIQELGIPGIILMENAGHGVATQLATLGACRTLICCGAGNNAGDGFVIARHLDNLGIETHVLLASSATRLRGDAATNFGWLSQTAVHLHDIEQTSVNELSRDFYRDQDWIVDALLGTGSHGIPRSPFDQIIRAANVSPARRLAVDIPTGLDSETGVASQTTFRADHTATFVAAKPGLVATAASPWVGEIHVHSIGVPSGLLRRFGLRGPDLNSD